VESRMLAGRILKFNRSTWWGLLSLAPAREAPMAFHATCYVGASSRSLPSVGDFVRVTFSDDSRTRLLSISLAPQDKGAAVIPII